MADAQDYLNAKEKAFEISEEVIRLFKNNKSRYSKDEVGFYSDQPSRMYAIYGEWGSGKTRVLEELQKEILSRKTSTDFLGFWKKERDRFKVIWFRPWEYEDETANVDQKLLAKLLENSSLSKKNERRLTYWFRNFSFTLILILIVILTINPLRNWGVSRLVEIPSLSTIQENNFILFLLTVGISLLLVLGTFIPTKLLSFFQWIKFGNIDFQSAQKIFTQISMPQTKREEVARIIQNSLGKDQKIFIFIDDLDRCRKETVINLLEHTKHFYSIDQLFFIFAIERKILASYIMEFYGYIEGSNKLFKLDGSLDNMFQSSSSSSNIRLKGDINDNDNPNKGFQYLDKIFEHSKTLKNFELNSFIRSEIKEHSHSDNISDIEIEFFEKAIHAFGYINIRKIKESIRVFFTLYKEMYPYKGILIENKYVSIYEIFAYVVLQQFFSEEINDKNIILVNDMCRNFNFFLNMNYYTIELIDKYIHKKEVMVLKPNKSKLSIIRYKNSNALNIKINDQELPAHVYGSDDGQLYSYIHLLFNVRKDDLIILDDPNDTKIIEECNLKVPKATSLK